MEKETKPSYYAVIPANVRYSKVPANAKLLYGEITALCSREGYCWASNEYFAKLYVVGKNTVSVWIQQLKKMGFIEYEVGSANLRKITLVGVDPITKNRDRYHEKSGEGYHEKSLHSITVESTTINRGVAQSATTPQAEEFFGSKELQNKVVLWLVQKGIPDQVAKSELQKFADYWTEKSKSGLKVRWQGEKYFDIRRRLVTWFSNVDKFSGGSRSKTKFASMD